MNEKRNTPGHRARTARRGEIRPTPNGKWIRLNRTELGSEVRERNQTVTRAKKTGGRWASPRHLKAQDTKVKRACVSARNPKRDGSVPGPRGLANKSFTSSISSMHTHTLMPATPPVIVCQWAHGDLLPPLARAQLQQRVRSIAPQEGAAWWLLDPAARIRSSTRSS